MGIRKAWVLFGYAFMRDQRLLAHALLWAENTHTLNDIERCTVLVNPLPLPKYMHCNVRFAFLSTYSEIPAFALRLSTELSNVTLTTLGYESCLQ